MGRAAGTAGREVFRNTGGRGYRPKQAQELAAMRAKRPGARREAEEKLRNGWTPEAVCGRARLDGRAHV